MQDSHPAPPAGKGTASRGVVSAPISFGELIDKIVILEIKGCKD